LLEQVPFEGWVLALRKFLGLKVKSAMMATRKTGDGVHPGFDQRVSEFLWIKIRSNVWDLFAGVKIEMNLSER
jgi:hypothetical protein